MRTSLTSESLRLLPCFWGACGHFLFYSESSCKSSRCSVHHNLSRGMLMSHVVHRLGATPCPVYTQAGTESAHRMRLLLGCCMLSQLCREQTKGTVTGLSAVQEDKA